ncbi:citrate lyase subunit alpha / citrate CoA-transferase [Anaerovirgula multivorans]|uniref:Citrate lyase alpha chain n=1 Tax=Anaerovirgula multivorans TaxID=312168 RepID=A0A239FU26_9FIRM|nr:citrate lyase subunit alpha [Anaerovirgula multivorans]SNS59414.1 citrate lyase subunit alpha / citrate CoA-transferase [Anaerovirgula multivorans]
MAINKIGREIPDYIEGIGELKSYEGPFSVEPAKRRFGRKISTITPKQSKILEDIEQAIIETGLKDGMTISFHHHFREGDYIINMVVDTIAKLGIKNITLAPSSLNSVHAPIIEHIKNGVITKIETSGLRGSLADAISKGILEYPVKIRSHGGRARAIEAGDVKIDVAFLGVPACDEYGNANGHSGKSFCGSLGYAKVDAQYADKVVLITDNLVPYPNVPASIAQTDVDFVVKMDAIGDPKGIVSGATRYTKNPRELLIAKYAATVIKESGYLADGFSMQCGTGGASLAVARSIKQTMIEKDIKASFALGGITGQFVEMLEEGLINKLYDTQCFDLTAAKSIGTNPNHVEIDAGFYANPHNKGCAVNVLDIVILSALEVDTEFNVNVITGSDGVLRGASGGHCDTAAGSKLSIIVAPLIRGRIPTIVENVNTVITPGETIDVVVTDRGIAVNPLRTDLIEKLSKTNLPIFTIEELKEKAEKIAGKPKAIQYGEKIVALVEYRDGTIIDVIKEVK